MSFVSSRHQKRTNAQLEQLAREAEAETNRRRLEIMELRRLERWQYKAGSQSWLEALTGDYVERELSSASSITFCSVTPAVLSAKVAATILLSKIR